jgi:hypothetical protein
MKEINERLFLDVAQLQNRKHVYRFKPTLSLARQTVGAVLT